MDLFTIQSLILVIIGIVAAILGVMFGAAGFVMLPAMLLLGIPIHASVAVNKFATGMSSFTTMIGLVVKKKVSVRELAPYMVLSSVGGGFGAFIATRFDDRTMNVIGCVILTIVFIIVLKPVKPLVAKVKPPKLLAAFIGSYDGALGPGSGSMYITYFSKSGEDYIDAAQKTRFLMFASCMSAFLFYWVYGIVQWGLAIPLTIGSIIGSYIAVRLMPYLNPKWMRIILPVIFAILIVQVVGKLV